MNNLNRSIITEVDHDTIPLWCEVSRGLGITAAAVEGVIIQTCIKGNKRNCLITQQAIANVLGISLRSVNKAIKKLVTAKVLEINNNEEYYALMYTLPRSKFHVEEGWGD